MHVCCCLALIGWGCTAFTELQVCQRQPLAGLLALHDPVAWRLLHQANSDRSVFMYVLL